MLKLTVLVKRKYFLSMQNISFEWKIDLRYARKMHNFFYKAHRESHRVDTFQVRYHFFVSIDGLPFWIDRNVYSDKKMFYSTAKKCIYYWFYTTHWECKTWTVEPFSRHVVTVLLRLCLSVCCFGVSFAERAEGESSIHSAKTSYNAIVNV